MTPFSHLSSLSPSRVSPFGAYVSARARSSALADRPRLCQQWRPVPFCDPASSCRPRLWTVARTIARRTICGAHTEKALRCSERVDGAPPLTCGALWPWLITAFDIVVIVRIRSPRIAVFADLHRLTFIRAIVKPVMVDALAHRTMPLASAVCRISALDGQHLAIHVERLSRRHDFIESAHCRCSLVDKGFVGQALARNAVNEAIEPLPAATICL